MSQRHRVDQDQRASLLLTRDLDVGAAGADVIYTDGRPRSTRQAGPDRDAFMTIQIDQTTLDRTGAETLLMHCMPVRRGDEVTAAALWRRPVHHPEGDQPQPGLLRERSRVGDVAMATPCCSV